MAGVHHSLCTLSENKMKDRMRQNGNCAAVTLALLCVCRHLMFPIPLLLSSMFLKKSALFPEQKAGKAHEIGYNMG